MKIRRIGVLSQAQIFAVVYGGFGVLIGLAWAGMIAARHQDAPAGVRRVIEAIAVVVIAPFAYALLGLIAGTIAAVLFNFAARITGGLEIEVVQEEAHSGQ